MSIKPRVRLTDAASVKSILGLATYWAWIDSSFFGTNLFRLSAQGAEAVRIAHLIALGAAVLATLACVLLARRLVPAFSTRSFAFGTAIVAALGTALEALSGGTASVTLLVAGSTLSGAAMGVMILLWAEAYSADPANRASVWIPGSIAVGVALHFLVAAMQPVAGIAMIVLLPVIGAGFLAMMRRPGRAPGDRGAGRPTGRPGTGEIAEDAAGGASSQQIPGLPAGAFGLPWRLALGLLVYGVAFGLMEYLRVPPSTEAFQAASYAQLAGRFSVALLIFVGTAAFAWSPHVTYRVGLLLMVAGYLVVPFLQSSFEYLPGLATMIGYSCFEMMVWVVLFEIIARSGASATRIVGSGRLVMLGGTLVGAAVGITLGSLVHLSSVHLAVISTAVAYSLMATTTLVLDENHVSGFWHLIKTTPEPGIVAPSLTERCAEIAAAYDLTPRETEVLALLASGRNIPYITRELTISEGTANSHVRHIYGKLNVHSRQELLDLTEGRTGAAG